MRIQPVLSAEEKKETGREIENTRVLKKKKKYI